MNKIKIFFCRHKYENVGTPRTFDSPKMTTNGKMSYNIQLKICKKCGKYKYVNVKN